MLLIYTTTLSAEANASKRPSCQSLVRAANVRNVRQPFNIRKMCRSADCWHLGTYIGQEESIAGFFTPGLESQHRSGGCRYVGG